MPGADLAALIDAARTDELLATDGGRRLTG